MAVEEHRAYVDYPSKPATTRTRRAGRGLSRTLWFEPSRVIGDSTYALLSGFAVSSDNFPLRELPTLYHECKRTGTSASSSAQYIDVVPCMFDITSPTHAQSYALVCVFFFVARHTTSVSATRDTQRYASRGSQVSLRMTLRASDKSATDAKIATKWVACCTPRRRGNDESAQCDSPCSVIASAFRNVCDRSCVKRKNPPGGG